MTLPHGDDSSEVDPKRLNDGQRSITKLRTIVIQNSLSQAHGEHTLHHTFQERPNHRLMNSSCSEGFHNSSLQEQLLQLSISTHQMIHQHARTLVLTSRNHPCGLGHRQLPASVAGPAVLLETLGHRCTLQLTSGTGSQISRKDSLPTGAWRMEEGPEFQPDTVSILAEDLCIFDASRNCDSTIGAQNPFDDSLMQHDSCNWRDHLDCTCEWTFTAGTWV